MAMPLAGPATAVAPVDVSALLRRLSATWSQPEPWIAAVVLATGAAVAFHHPIAKMIGTEVDSVATPSVVAPAPVVPVTAPTAAAALAGSRAAVPTHAPRNPFRALVTAGKEALAPEQDGALSTGGLFEPPVGSLPVTKVTTAKPDTAPTEVSKPAPTTGSSSCAGTVHRVVSGDTLWTLAATAVKSTDSARVTVAWHRLYKANKPPLSNPSMLSVGMKICVPDSL